MKGKTIQHLEDNTGEYVYDIGIGKRSLKQDLKH